MGKDNSSSKSELRLQSEKKNKAVKKAKKTLEKCLQKLNEEKRREKQRNKAKKMILKRYVKRLSSAKGKDLTYKERFTVTVVEYLTEKEINMIKSFFPENSVKRILTMK